MLVLFDNGTPRTLARYLVANHLVTEARARGWEQLGNGDLLREAEAAGFLNKRHQGKFKMRWRCILKGFMDCLVKQFAHVLLFKKL